ncbi:lipoprotein [Catellatospora sp. TT07R-123]|nr:lipoprotein [Catellatospora sp. TT07R-123]
MRRILTAATLATLAVAAAGCDSDSPTPADTGSAVIAVAADDTHCGLTRTSGDAGTVTFRIANTGTKVTEFYVYAVGDRVMGEVENITPGLTRDLSVELPPGTYQTSCRPGMSGTGIRADFTVAGSAAPLTADAKLKDATDAYHRYVVSQADAFLTRTGEFVTAVKNRDTAKAKSLYPVARTYWERIEPVASSFGDLDPKIDGRAEVADDGMQFTGFHRIEQDLWVNGDVAKDGPIADQLLADVTDLVARAKTVQFNPLQLANGAKSLLDEIASGKITGEEERYSHTDLWDFQANLEGAQAAVQALRPALLDRDPATVAELDRQFAAVRETLGRYATADGWKLHTELTTAQLRELSDAVNALAEPVSKIAAVISR